MKFHIFTGRELDVSYSFIWDFYIDCLLYTSMLKQLGQVPVVETHRDQTFYLKISQLNI